MNGIGYFCLELFWIFGQNSNTLTIVDLGPIARFLCSATEVDVALRCKGKKYPVLSLALQSRWPKPGISLSNWKRLKVKSPESRLECPTRALKTWKLEISSSSQVRFNLYQFQVFRFKTWRTWKFQVKSSLKSYKLDLTWKLKVRELFQSQVNLRPNFAQNLMMIH